MYMLYVQNINNRLASLKELRRASGHHWKIWCVYVPIHPLTLKHIHTCMHTYTNTHARTHARTHAHKYTHTHTHTHTHTYTHTSIPYTLTSLVDEDTFMHLVHHTGKGQSSYFVLMLQKCCFEFKKELQCSSHLQPYILSMYSCILSSLSILPGPILIPHNVPSIQCTMTSDEWPQQINKHGLLYRGSVSLMSAQNYGHYR